MYENIVPYPLWSCQIPSVALLLALFLLRGPATIYPYLFSRLSVGAQLNFATHQEKRRLAALKLPRYARLETFNYTRKRHHRPSSSRFLNSLNVNTNETGPVFLLSSHFFLSYFFLFFFHCPSRIARISSIHPSSDSSPRFFSTVPLSLSRTRNLEGKATIITAFSRVHVEYKVSRNVRVPRVMTEHLSVHDPRSSAVSEVIAKWRRK